MDVDKFRTALSYIDPTDRETWVTMGMAVKHGLGEIGFEIWDTWSQGAASYKKSSSVSVWRSIAQYGRITESTLFRFALDAGWRPAENDLNIIKVNIKARQAEMRKEELRRQAAQGESAKKAVRVISECEQDISSYLTYKGFPLAQVNMLKRYGKMPLIVIPMYKDDKICGCQFIDPDGNKKFLRGQLSRGAYHLIGHGSKSFFVEGYASALSLKYACDKIDVDYKIVVCFSAANMSLLASGSGGMVIADNDVSGTGQKYAELSGCEYWMPPIEGMDINDYHQHLSDFKFEMAMRRVLISKR